MFTGSTIRRIWAGGGSLVAMVLPLAAAVSAELQPTLSAPTGAGIVEEVVITGTRLPPNGFQTPTPVTATPAADLRAAAPNNLADALAQLPAFNANIRTENPVTAAALGYNGQNLLNLRNLGPNRTLVLLDGRRLPASNSLGSVDVNMLPQALVQRVDVVTGGASATYGSDAVAGVVNFIPDTHAEGLKADIQGGVSTHNDLPSGQLSLTYGHGFMHGRARLIASAEAATQNGVGPVGSNGRDWFDVAAGQIPNPAGGVPKVIVIPDIRNGLGTYGGLITSGPLKGTQFLPGGATAPFTPGSIVGSTFQSGGDGARINIGFSPNQKRAVTFLHGEFDATDHLTLFAEAHYAYSRVDSDNFVNPHTGKSNQYTIFSGNAFLPAPVQGLMTANNISSFTLGRYELDFPLVQIDATTDMERAVLGGKGKLADSWLYDLSYSYGQTNQEISENNLTINRRLYAAADAVTNAAGQIVCRSTLAGLDPGCVPLNLFGVGSPSAAAIHYVTGDSVKNLTIKQSVVAFNISGDLGEHLRLAAGPIGVATGLEYRHESADQTVDALSPQITDFTGVRGAPGSRQGRQGSFNFFNPLPLAGHYDIKEAYAELGVPVLNNRPFFHALNLDAAARYADYSQSGGVTTWKVGVNWQINSDVRLRLTKSEDIRGPNILELFDSGTQGSNNQVYQGKTTPALVLASGNSNLNPETARTLTYGVVYQPSYVPGLQMSLDYYDITINDAIGQRTAQQTIDQCAAGNQSLCSLITVTPQGTLIIYTPSLNLSVQKVAGYDFEAAYTKPLAGGRLSLRLLANHETIAYTQAPGSPPIPTLGESTTPSWRGNFQAGYQMDRWSGFVQERYIGHAVFNATYIEGVDTSNNTVPSIAYTDVTGTYAFGRKGGQQLLFLTVNNVFDKVPPVVTSNPTTFSTPTSLAYDRIGRYFTAGVRFRF